MLQNLPLEDQGAARGGADVAEFVVQLAYPLGPIPLAARGLAAVLARAGPTGVASRSRLRKVAVRKSAFPQVGRPLAVVTL
jgi:hypothetical protein